MSTTTLTATGKEIATTLGFTPKSAILGNWPEAGEKYVQDEELKEYGKFLISKYRPDLTNIDIAYLFKESAKSNDVKKSNDLNKVLHGIEAVIVISWEDWKELDVDNKLRTLYIELEKIFWNDESGKIETQDPTVSSFPSVMRVFGPSSDAEIELISAYQEFSKLHGK